MLTRSPAGRHGYCCLAAPVGIYVRQIRCEVGAALRAVAVLRATAARMLRDRVIDGVIICQRPDAPEALLWLESRQDRSTQVPGLEVTGIDEGILEDRACGHRLLPLHGFYHVPLPGSRVWLLEINSPQPRLTAALIRLCNRPTADERVRGVAIYRFADEPSRLLGFLALAPEVAARDFFLDVAPVVVRSRAMSWHPVLIAIIRRGAAPEGVRRHAS